ncbi:hypothetical protein CesoFtcFv8_015481 [Champsocephalus esox]|uniref:Uncharacterized protein n=1 Tax=Champsocephalus esox TaxID=159716 RepID=A0AAN8BQ87_9TELE|nr:hypothetical protein CesoFtcFv8_015481 [Champsocephalus esox]
MDFGTKRVAGIIAQVALLLCSSSGTHGAGEQAARFLISPGERERVRAARTRRGGSERGLHVSVIPP